MTETPSVQPGAYLAVEDLAALLHLSPRGARRVLERGDLPGFRIGRRWYVRARDLDAAVSAKVAEQCRDPDAAVRLLRGLPAARNRKELP